MKKRILEKTWVVAIFFLCFISSLHGGELELASSRAEVIHKSKKRPVYHMVFAGEGYRAQDQKKFIKDAKKALKYFFTIRPFVQVKDHIKVSALKVISRDKGISQLAHWSKSKNKWVDEKKKKNTAFSSRLTVGRYIITLKDLKNLGKVRNKIRGKVDLMVVIINSPKYGGTGYTPKQASNSAYYQLPSSQRRSYSYYERQYNYGILVSSAGKNYRRVFVHEAGHAICNLGDEYFNKQEVYPPKGKEPNHVNVTKEKDRAKVKWRYFWKSPGRKLLYSGEYSSFKLGVFEGSGGYGKKLYRPTKEGCIMKSEHNDEFCPVCYEALLQALVGKKLALRILKREVQAMKLFLRAQSEQGQGRKRLYEKVKKNYPSTRAAQLAGKGKS